VARKKARGCRKSGCYAPLHLGGLCREHYEEGRVEEERRDDALTALHHATVDGTPLQSQELREELLKLRSWWHKACDVAQFGQSRPLMPHDEAEYAVEWCISLAKEIVTAERALRANEIDRGNLERTRLWVWERFDALEAGFRSNGTPLKSDKTLIRIQDGCHQVDKRRG